jgi:hypothetical protein
VGPRVDKEGKIENWHIPTTSSLEMSVVETLFKVIFEME